MKSLGTFINAEGQTVMLYLLEVPVQYQKITATSTKAVTEDQSPKAKKSRSPKAQKAAAGQWSLSTKIKVGKSVKRVLELLDRGDKNAAWACINPSVQKLVIAKLRREHNDRADVIDFCEASK